MVIGWDSALDIKTNFKLEQPLPLFTKLNMDEILEKEMPPEETNELANVKPEITFDDFKKLDIRIGTVEKVEPHSNADKLWLLDVNFGDWISNPTQWPDYATPARPSRPTGHIR